MSTSALHRLDATAIAEAVGARAVSAVEVTRHHLDRIARLDPRLKAFTHLDAPGALAAAAALDARLAQGEPPQPLAGVPAAVKANVAAAGLPWHGGFGAFARRTARTDAPCVARLRAAGAIVLGVLNLHEGALGATTANPHFGATQNPHRPGFTPGGSSGGSGAAVAAGLCALALGTDTLGSIRIPAAYCGIFGHKPTHGLVPADGLMPLVERWDVIGPMARSVRDLTRALRVLARPDPAPPIGRVAVPDSWETVDTHPAVAAALHLASDLLRGLGRSVERVAFPVDHHRVRLAGFVTAAAEADRHYGGQADRDPQGFSAAFRQSLAFARGFAPEARAEGERRLAEAAAALRAALLSAEALLLPTTPQPAFPHDGPVPVSQADFAAPASIAGLPAVALPAGWTRDGLPVGVQLVGRPGADLALLDLAEELAQALQAHRWPIIEEDACASSHSST
ncbi:MAG: amidase [Sphingomonadaceae bacterium]|uniref:amidase n=1 Tax=Thermaurantiacus sp. TaxID=2820283 RepID=UPI00298F378F|nr:amidase [Thermaurantiacus sp.]MCS6987195.1 amidase [Sphingomonadaceae bacterium]MDW8415771.1 amidase [Thermaurantiacus sp.]